MIQLSPFIAQMGISDAPDWAIIVFGIWPFHIGSALGLSSGMTLRGYGPAAVAFQSLMLLFLIGAAVFLFRSPKIPLWLKILYLPFGYPIVTVATNLIPCYV